MSVILVIQPDAPQAKVLRDVSRRIGADLVVVDSVKRAVDAIGRHVPDLILLSAFLSPRDEDTLMATLRSLDGTSHLQTLSIPQFRSAEEAKGKKSGFGFRKKQKPTAAIGADPAAFADEVIALLHRATEIRNRPAPPDAIESVIAQQLGELGAPGALGASGAMGASSAMGGWGTIEEPTAIDEAPVDEVPIEDAPVEEEALEAPIAFAAPIAPIAPIAPVAPKKRALSIADEISQLVNQLGIDLGPTDALSAPSEIVADDADVFDFGASLDRARNAITRPQPEEVPQPQVDANAIREAALAEAREAAEREAEAKAAELARVQQIEAEAKAAELARVQQAEAEARAAELARVQQAEADALREAAIAEARATAEREAREALAADLIRVQAEAEQMRETAIAEARAVAEREARETLAAEVARVRSEAETTLTDALHKVKTEAEENERRRIEAERLKMEAERARVERINAEAQQAFARELSRVRADVEQSLAVQLDAARKEADRVRAAEAEAIRERAAVETQLKSELDRLRFVTAQTRKADESENKKAAQQIKQLEAELASVRAKTESHKGDELEDIRAQMAELREAAAEHARAAAAEAVAAEVARATARPTAVIAQFPVRQAVPIEPREETESRATRDYLSVWQSNASERIVAEEAVDADEPEENPISAINVRRHAKWALPVAACLVIVVNTGSALSTVAWLVKSDEAPKTVVKPLQEQPPFIEVVEKRVGRLQLNSTPPGAEAILDGKSYGKTPLTINDLDAGLHTLELKAKTGTITRKVTIKANQTTLLTESIFSGWLAIFSPIPLKVLVDGRAVSLNDDGRVMTTPGEHVVEFINEQFNFRAVETFSLRPGETVAHTVTLPTGTVRVVVPEGAQVKVDGQPPAGNPVEGLSLVIGAHEISATHPQLGERRAAIDVKQGGLTEVNLQFGQ